MDLQTEMSVSKGWSKKIDSCYKPENRNGTNTTILAAPFVLMLRAGV